MDLDPEVMMISKLLRVLIEIVEEKSQLFGNGNCLKMSNNKCVLG
jgi:hypothetical protein